MAQGAGVLVAGLGSIAWMSAVSFMIDSNFKWVVLGFALLWAGATGGVLDRGKLPGRKGTKRIERLITMATDPVCGMQVDEGVN